MYLYLFIGTFVAYFRKWWKLFIFSFLNAYANFNTSVICAKKIGFPFFKQMVKKMRYSNLWPPGLTFIFTRKLLTAFNGGKNHIMNLKDEKNIHRYKWNSFVPKRQVRQLSTWRGAYIAQEEWVSIIRH